MSIYMCCIDSLLLFTFKIHFNSKDNKILQSLESRGTKWSITSPLYVANTILGNEYFFEGNTNLKLNIIFTSLGRKHKITLRAFLKIYFLYLNFLKSHNTSSRCLMWVKMISFSRWGKRKRALYNCFNDKEWIRFKMILPVQAQMVVTYFHCMGREWV